MKKKLMALALGLALVFAFTACGDSDSDSSGDGDTGSKELNIFMWSDYIPMKPSLISKRRPGSR
jgi:ABC-type glycerol-3-phosphate transport system substrate-binding protein